MFDEKNKSAEDKLKEQNANLTQRVEMLEDKIEVLEEALNASAKGSITVEEEDVKKDPPKIPEAVKVGKRKVVFTAPAFKHRGKKIIAEEAVKDKALMEELLEKYPGLLVDA